MNSKKCDVEVFSRVTGFYRPVQTWNKGKTAEFSYRQRYNIEEEVTEGVELAGICVEDLKG